MSFVPYICMQTNSTCYKETIQMQVKGVLWHSTGVNNTDLCRYVQPTDGSPNYDADIKKLGKNTNGNDWNHVDVDAGLNAWIGKFADGSVGTVQTMPWDFKPWGCYYGVNGSCNNGWIQFEICEDSLKDKDYANKVFEEGCQLTAYLCKIFRLNPNGYADCNGVSVPVITCHNDAAKLGLGSYHADINHWFPKLIGKDMRDVRKRVYEILNGTQPSTDYYTGPLPTETLVRGDYGYQVGYLQDFLNWYGSYGLDRDNSFGPATERAVIDYQRNTGLEADGSFGPASREMAEHTKKKSTDTMHWTGNYPTLPGRGYFIKGDGYDTYVSFQNQIKYIQEYMNWAIGSKLDIDGCYGPATVKAVKAFQKVVNITQDGSYGQQTLAKAKTFEKKVG